MAARRKIEFLLTAKDKMAAGFRSAQTKLEKFRKSAAGLASSLGIVFAGGGVIAGIKRMATEMDGLAKTARKLGTTTEELSKLRYAAELTGVAANTLDQGLQRMVRRVAEAAQGTGEAKSALEELGLKAEDLAKLSMDEQFKTIADAMGDITSQSDKVRLAFKLFDSGGVAIINTMEGGREALNKYGKEAEELGGVVSGKATPAMEKFNDNLSRIQTRVEGLGRYIANKIIPAFNVWYDFLRGTPVGWLGDTEAANNELQKTARAIVSIKEEMERLESWRNTHDWLIGDTEGLDDRLAALREELKKHEDAAAQIIRNSAVKREKKRTEQEERAHNSEMAAARKADVAALKGTLTAKEQEFQRHNAALQAHRNEQKGLFEEIKSTIEEIRNFGKEQPDATPYDYLSKASDAQNLISAGDFAGAMAAIREAMTLFQQYQKAGKASSADVILMTKSFEELAKAAQAAQGSKLEEAAVRAAAAHQDLKDEIEGKPIKAPVEASEDSGRKIWIGAQNQVQAEGPIKVAVELGLSWGATVPGVATQGDVQQQDVQTESLKRGYRI